MRRKTYITIDIWDYIDINAINKLLDDELSEYGGFATDIEYTCKSVTKDGDINIEATYSIDGEEDN